MAQACEQYEREYERGGSEACLTLTRGDTCVAPPIFWRNVGDHAAGMGFGDRWLVLLSRQPTKATSNSSQTSSASL